MKLGTGTLKFPEKWSKTKIDNKILVILYFLGLHLGSAPILSIFISTSSSSSHGSFLNSQTLFYIGDFNINGDVWQVAGFLIFYWLCMILLLGLGMVGSSGNIIIQAVKWIFGIFIVLVDLMTNVITFYLAKATLTNKQVITVLVVFFSLTWASNTLLSAIYHKIFITLVPNPNNHLSHRQDTIIYLGKTVEDLFFGIHLIVVCVLQENQGASEFYYIVLILIYSSRLYSLIKEKYFIQNTSHYLYVIGTIFCLALLIIVQLQQFTSNQILTQNFYPIVCTLTIFGMWSFYRHEIQRLQTILLMQPNQVVNFGQEISYLDSLLELYLHRNQNDWEFIVSAFYKINVQKICAKDQHAKSKLNSFQNSTPKDSSFKECIKRVLNDLYKLTTNEQVHQQILYMKLVLLEDVFSVSTSIYINQNTPLKEQNSIFLQLSTHLIKKKIASIIENQNNKQLYKVNANPIIKLQKNMQAMWELLETDVIVKFSKWKKLSNDFYQSQQIMQKIVHEIRNLSKFDQLYQNSKQDYKNCIQFLSLSLFFYSAVVFMSKRSHQIRKNLDKIRKLTFKLKLNNEKQKMLAYKFTNRFCFIELNITENLEQKIVLTIKKCDKNAKKIFKCNNSTKYQYCSLNKIFPQFIANEMEELACREIRKNSGNVVHTYLMDFEGNVFEATTIFQIVPTEDGLSCVMLISEKEKDRIILLDSQGFIQSVGKKYLNHFPSADHHMVHFSTILFQPSVFEFLQNEFLKQKAQSFKKIQLINMKQKKEDWYEQVEMIKKWMVDEKVSKLKSVDKQNSSTLHYQKLKKHEQQNFNLHAYYAFIQQLRFKSRTKFFNNFGAKFSDDLTIKSSKIVETPLQVFIRFKKCQIGGKQFYHISLVSVDQSHHNHMTKLLKGVLYKYKQGADNGQQQTSTNLLHANPQLASNISNFQLASLMSSQQDELFNFQERGYGNQQHQQQEQQMELVNFDIGKNKGSIMSWVEKLFQNSELMFDSRLFRFSTILCGLCVFLSLVVSIGYLFLAGYLKEQQQIMQMDCTVSDTFKLTELLYNTAITYHLFNIEENGANSTNATIQNNLRRIQKSYEQQKQLILQMLVEQQSNYEAYHTMVTGIPFYSYLRGELSWMMLPKINFSNINGTYQAQNFMAKDQITIKTMQMLQLFLVHVETIFNGQSITTNTNTTNNTSINSTSISIAQVDKSLTSLTDNFPELKRLNHQNVQYYSELTQNTYSKVTLFIIILISIHTAITFTVIVVIHREVSYRQLQTFRTVELYTFIPTQILSKISFYYTHLNYQIQILFEEKVSKQKKLSQNRHQMITDFLTNKLQTYQSSVYRDQIHRTQNVSKFENLQTKVESYSRAPTNVINTQQRDFTVLRILVFAIIANLLFIYGVYKLIIINNTLKDVIIEVGSLMDAETYLLESYFDLKGNFIIPASRFDQQFFEELLRNQQLSDVVFNDVALNSLKIFSQYDPEFATNLISLLTDDICHIIKQQLSEVEYKQCTDTSKMQYFENGIVVTVNYLTRKIYQTILQSQSIANQFNDTVEKVEIFKILRQKEHWEIDENIFYIFRMFQLLQQIITMELQTVANLTISQCQLLIIIELFIATIIFSVWNVVNYRKFTKQIKKLYLSLMLLNEELIGEAATGRVTKKAVKMFAFHEEFL